MLEDQPKHAQRILLFAEHELEAKSIAENLQLFSQQKKIAIDFSQCRQLEQGHAISCNVILQCELQEKHLIEEALSHFLDRQRTEQCADYLYFKNACELHNMKLAVFDMDSTLIQTEVIDDLAAYAGMQDQVKKITAAAMRGELNFAQSFEQRIALLRGVNESALKKIAEQLPFMPGLRTLFHRLAEKNVVTAIISGGFQYFADFLKEELNVNYAFANQLEIVDSKLTGAYQDEILGPEQKRDLLKMLAEKHQLSLKQCLAVGDGANDLLMLQTAGVGIAFHAKPLLKRQVAHHIDYVSLDALLSVLD